MTVLISGGRDRPVRRANRLLLLDGDRFVEVGDGLHADETLDADGCVVGPGSSTSTPTSANGHREAETMETGIGGRDTGGGMRRGDAEHRPAQTSVGGDELV